MFRAIAILSGAFVFFSLATVLALATVAASEPVAILILSAAVCGTIALARQAAVET